MAKQPRKANGEFASVGSSVTMAGAPAGTMAAMPRIVVKGPYAAPKGYAWLAGHSRPQSALSGDHTGPGLHKVSELRPVAGAMKGVVVKGAMGGKFK